MTLSKASKTLLTLALSSSLFLSLSQSSVLAESNLEPVDFEITPLACPEAGTYTTVYSNKTQWKSTDFTHEANNPGPDVDSVSRSVSISHQATVDVGGEYEFKTLMVGAKITANVGYGFNSTKSVTTTWNFGKGRWNLVAGNQYVKATGTRYKIAATNCSLTEPRAISATYTHQTWSDKIPLN
ncbi:hypothetical protein [Bacillus sp. FJAT-22090]|uniref:hypothetical protein n=1 Tax=Bacillus sp. FJAT-22090 TaxID=1581038 RepID=UPI0011A56071|nr:hypothetical protein [Bacillus sp. FJAT-22090]